MVEVRLEVPLSVSAQWVKRVVGKTLKLERKSDDFVGVLLTNNKEIRKINKKHLNHDYATDVIAFGLDEKNVLGDIMVSAEMARRVAKELKIPFKEELARYLVHGTLHLLGYEDKPKKKYDRMHKRQEAILKKLGFSGRRKSATGDAGGESSSARSSNASYERARKSAAGGRTRRPSSGDATTMQAAHRT